MKQLRVSLRTYMVLWTLSGLIAVALIPKIVSTYQELTLTEEELLRLNYEKVAKLFKEREAELKKREAERKKELLSRSN